MLSGIGRGQGAWCGNPEGTGSLEVRSGRNGVLVWDTWEKWGYFVGYLGAMESLCVRCMRNGVLVWDIQELFTREGP